MGADTPRLRNRVLALIAAFKLIKVVLLLVLAAAIWHLLRPDVAQALADRLLELPLAEGHRFVLQAAVWLAGLTPWHIRLLALAALAYAALFAFEGVGLWLGRRWAEYLTVIATLSLVPFEAMEIIRRCTTPKVVALVVNLAIAGYLVRLLSRQSGTK